MLLAILVVLAQDPATITLVPPEKAKLDDVKKAAAAMEARCKAFGYQNVTAKVGKAKSGPTVELTCKDGFTKAMQERVRTQLTAHPITKHELAISYNMPDAEADRFPAPDPKTKDPSKVKAPEGTTWMQIGFMTNPESTPYMQLVVSRLSAGDFQADAQFLKDGTCNIAYTLTEQGKKKWDAIPERLRGGGLVAIYNGGYTFMAYTGGLVEKAGKVSADCYVQPQETMAVAHPLPFQLR